MTPTYKEENLNKLKARNKSVKKNLLIIFLLCTFVCIILCFFTNRDNQVYFIIANTLILSFSLWTISYKYFSEIAPNNAKILQFQMVLGGKGQEISGNVKSISKAYTISKNIVVKEISVNGDVKRNLYWDLVNGDIPFKENDNVNFKVINNYISAYELLKGEQND